MVVLEVLFFVFLVVWVGVVGGIVYMFLICFG